jgi:hypothetical protein
MEFVLFAEGKVTLLCMAMRYGSVQLFVFLNTVNVSGNSQKTLGEVLIDSRDHETRTFMAWKRKEEETESH